MEGRVRWFLGLARNSGGYSLPMMGTPCDVPLPRKMNENDMAKFSFAEGARRLHIGGANVTMLTALRIKNLALVPDLTLELQPGCNVITGETGAGKSIIIGALNLVLGERADRSLIRNGSDSCSVEAVFDLTRLRAPLKSFLDENGLEPCEEN